MGRHSKAFRFDCVEEARDLLRLQRELRAREDGPILRQNPIVHEECYLSRQEDRGRRTQTPPPPPRHRTERPGRTRSTSVGRRRRSSRRAIETLPGGGYRVVSRAPRTVACTCCGAAPDPTKRPVAKTTNRC